MSDRAVAGIQYHGSPGVTQSCLDALVRLIQFGERISDAKLLSFSHRHLFLFLMDETDRVVIKAGFTSGYRGEGPRGLATAIRLLQKHQIRFEEFDITKPMLLRSDRSAMTASDIEVIDSLLPIRPVRYPDYIYDEDGRDYGKSDPGHVFPSFVPYGVLDPRIYDLAIDFERDPDAALMSGYRRLEQLVRERCQLRLVGAQLFAKAFQGDQAVLAWPQLKDVESRGAASLFSGCFLAYRNRRAHSEVDSDRVASIREFLLLNELFHLESAAIFRPAGDRQLSD